MEFTVEALMIRRFHQRISVFWQRLCRMPTRPEAGTLPYL
jgi:hypothetical protein